MRMARMVITFLQTEQYYAVSGQFTYVVRNTPGGNSSLVARADFGGSSKVKTTIFYPKLTLKAPDFTPVTYDSVTTPQ